MSNQRKAMCIWCGHEVWYAEGDTAGQEKAWADLIAHDGTCPKNPTAAERDRYREALVNLLDAIHTMPGIPNSELCKAMCSARETLNEALEK